MATKDFSKMATKKLNALLETASDEDRVAIQDILDARAQALKAPAKGSTAQVMGQAEGQEYNNPEPLSPVEEELLKKAEEKPAKAKKLTDEERIALAEELREKVVNHRCQVVPFNTIDWVDGTIVGIVEEKRANKVLLAIKLDDGRRVVKVHDSNLLRIFEETVEPTKRASLRNGEKREEWTPEKMEAEVMEAAVNVGKFVTLKEGETEVVGRVMAVIPEKRSQRCLYRIEVEAPTEDNPKAIRTIHKVSASTDLTFSEDFDEKGKELNTKFIERRERAAAKAPLTPESRVVLAEEALKKAEEALKKAETILATRKEALEIAKKELDEFLANRTSVDGTAATPTAEEPLD